MRYMSQQLRLNAGVSCTLRASHASRFSDVVCLTRLRACMDVVQRVSQGFLTRLVTDGVFLTCLDALEVVVQGVLRGFLMRLVSVGVFLTRLIAVEVVVQRVLRGFLTRLASDGGWGVQTP